MVNKMFFKASLFFVLLALFAPSVSFGQKLVGVIFSGNIPYYRAMHVALLKEVKQKGVDKELKFITQFPAPDPVALSNTAKKLIVGGVDMVITYGFPATKAMLAKESDIPVVYVGVYQPSSLIVNVGPLTGCGYTLPLSSLLRYYKQTMEISRLVAIYSPNEEDSDLQMSELAELAEQNKINLSRLGINSRSDMKKLDSIQEGDAVFITGSTVAHVMIKDIMTKLREFKIPAVDVFPDTAEEGVLIALYQDPDELGKNAAMIVEKIIGGEEAESIEPVVHTTTKLIVNAHEAKELGLTPPPQLIGDATQVIE